MITYLWQMSSFSSIVVGLPDFCPNSCCWTWLQGKDGPHHCIYCGVLSRSVLVSRLTTIHCGRCCRSRLTSAATNHFCSRTQIIAWTILAMHTVVLGVACYSTSSTGCPRRSEAPRTSSGDSPNCLTAGWAYVISWHNPGKKFKDFFRPPSAVDQRHIEGRKCPLREPMFVCGALLRRGRLSLRDIFLSGDGTRCHRRSPAARHHIVKHSSASLHSAWYHTWCTSGAKHSPLVVSKRQLALQKGKLWVHAIRLNPRINPTTGVTEETPWTRRRLPTTT